MAISKEAERNHEALFRSHKSTLKVTDPEFVELFDNWAFDEVLKHSVLDARTRLMVQLAAIMACQAANEYRVMLGGALNVGVSPIEVKEIVYQAVPYLGIARVFDFIHATNEVLRERGISLPLEGDLRRANRSDAGEGAEGPAPHPGLSRRELLRRLLHARRARPEDTRAPHIRDACSHGRV
jgi:4-carboxymuconolactone decarboxylase